MPMRKLLSQILAALLGLWLTFLFVPGVRIGVYPDSSFFGIALTANWQIFTILGIILGLLNFFVKPILDIISLPLRIITLGIFGFIVNIGIIWTLDVIFRELYIPLWMPLIYTTLIVWFLNFFINRFVLKTNHDN